MARGAVLAIAKYLIAGHAFIRGQVGEIRAARTTTSSWMCCNAVV